MKKLLTLTALSVLGLFQNANAQIESYNAYGDSIIGCQNLVNGYVFIGAQDETAGSIEVNWGDGTSDTYPFTASANGYHDYLEYHTYAVPGNYTIDIQFYSGTSAAYIGTGEQMDVVALSQNSCGYFNGYVSLANPQTFYYDIPLDFTGANGITTTIIPSATYYSNYNGLDPGNAPYTVSINDAWLATNGFVQSNADFTIASFEANGNGGFYNFYITCSTAATNPDISISYLWPSNFVAPLQTGTLYAYVCNNACANSANTSLSLDFPIGFTPVTTGLTNPVINGSNLTFDILNLSDCQLITIPFTFPGNTAAGTYICFDMTATAANDIFLGNNDASNCGYVLNSYDPNAKEVNKPQQIDATVQETLEYMIHFQNDGNYSAVNVELIDTLSENLDLSTFRLVGAKHGVSFTLDPATRIVKFVFNTIYLAPSSQDLNASQGYVIYEIKEVAGLGLGEEIENTAYIYFDYNPAIVTNTTFNVNTELGIEDNQAEKIALYPNPANAKFQVSGTDLEEIRIFDMTGKEVLTSKLTNTNSVDVENLSNGVYTCVITSKTNVYQQKLTIKK